MADEYCCCLRPSVRTITRQGFEVAATSSFISTVCLSVGPSVRLSVCQFPGQNVKGQGHMGCSKFLACPLRCSLPIQAICFICGTNTIHDWTMCRAPILGQKVKGQGHTGQICVFSVRFIVLCLFDRFASYVAQIQPMTGLCVTQHFQVNRSKVKVTMAVWNFKRVRAVTPCLLFAELISYMAEIQPMGEDVSHAPCLGQKVQGPMSFKVLAVSAP